MIRKKSASLWKLATLLETRIKNKKQIHRILEFNKSQCLKPYVKFNTQKKNRNRKNGDKDGKALHKLQSNAVYSKTMENFRNRIDVNLTSNNKDYLKWISKPSCMTQNIFGNNLVAICKNKVTLTRNKPSYVRMCILGLRKVLMYEFQYDHFKNKYGHNARLLFTDTDSLMYEIKTKFV